MVRVYWYLPRQIVPWQGRREELAKKVVTRYGVEVGDLTVDEVIAAAKRWYDQEREKFDTLRNEIFEGIQRRTDFLEFKYVGQYDVRPFIPYRISRGDDGALRYWGTQVGEKGVDVGIAVDMLAKMPHYDAAVLVSGDADFLPAVGHLKDSLRYVYQFSLAKGVPPSVRSLSPWLQCLVDCHAWIDERELLVRYLDRGSIPSGVLPSIDARITQLGLGTAR